MPILKSALINISVYFYAFKKENPHFLLQHAKYQQRKLNNKRFYLSLSALIWFSLYAAMLFCCEQTL